MERFPAFRVQGVNMFERAADTMFSLALGDWGKKSINFSVKCQNQGGLL